jgi:hypothetical protein
VTYACTHPIPTTTRAGHCPALPRSDGLITGAGAMMASVINALTPQLPADRVYGNLLEASGGKLTDALEREADRRMRGS